MTRGPYTLVAFLPPELALPFVLAYCRRFGIVVDNVDAANNVWWWGAFVHGRLCAVMGLQLISETTMFVYGWYGDGSGSREERIALKRLVRITDELEFNLEGNILLDNARARMIARKHGWKFDGFEGDETNRRVYWKGKRPLAEVRAAVSA